MSPAATPNERTALVASSSSSSSSLPPSYNGDTRISGTKKPRHHNLAGMPPWRFRLACGSVWSATFLAAFDGTVVATLLSDIGSSFQALHLSSWLGTAYLLSLCCFTPVYGRLADALGRRNALLVALAFFTVGTLLCATAPTMYALIGARILAGVGGGGLTSVGSILVSDLVDLRHRGLFQGYANLLFGLGASLGGPVGGWAADQFGWRVAFGAQVPMLAASVALVLLFIPHDLGHRSESEEHETWVHKLKRIDYLGSAALVVSVACLLLGVSLKTAAQTADGGEYAWSDPLIAGLLTTFVVFTAVFIYIEGWVALNPVLPLSLLARRTPASVALSNLTMAMCMFSLLYNVPLFFTAVRLQSSTTAGAHLLPYTAFIGLGSLLVGWVMRKTGRFYPAMVVSGIIVAASCAMMLSWSTDSPEWITWVAQSPSGFGYAGVLTSTLVALMTNVQKEGRGEIAVATSMTYMFRTIGQVLGVAFASAVLQATLKADLAAGIDDRDLVDLIRRSTTIIPSLPPHIRAVAVAAYSNGLHRVCLMNFGLAVLTVVLLATAENEHMPESALPDDDEDVCEA